MEIIAVDTARQTVDEWEDDMAEALVRILLFFSPRSWVRVCSNAFSAGESTDCKGPFAFPALPDEESKGEG